MNKSIGLQLALYSLLLAGGSYLTHHLAPTLALPTLIAGLAGAVLCLIWAVRAIAGSRGKALPILTLIPVSFVMLSQTVLAWWGGAVGVSGGRTAAILITLLLALSVGMLMRIAYAGLFLSAQPSAPAKAKESTPLASGKPAALARAANSR